MEQISGQVAHFKCSKCTQGNMLYTGIAKNRPTQPLSHDWSKPTEYLHKCNSCDHEQHIENITYPRIA